MCCRIWGPNEAENTPRSRPLGQLGGEENEQYLVPALFFFKMQNGAVFDKNRDFFANFQFSPPISSFVQYYSLIDHQTFNFFNLTPGSNPIQPL